MHDGSNFVKSFLDVHRIGLPQFGEQLQAEQFKFYAFFSSFSSFDRVLYPVVDGSCIEQFFSCRFGFNKRL